MTDSAADATPGDTSALARAARVLDAFDSATPQLTLTEVVRRCGLPRSSVHRILDQLVRLRWLERDRNHYRLGLGLLELGALAAQHNRLRGVALPHLRELHGATGLPVHLAVLDGHDIVYLERVGSAPVPPRLGGRQPAHCTGAGKAILAYAAPELAENVIAAGIAPRTPFTITRPRVFRQELSGVRERGVAFDREESHSGVACVAAPIRGAGAAIAAVSVSGPPPRLRNRRLVPAVLSAARGIWLGLHSPARRRRAVDTRHAAAGAPYSPWPAGAMDEVVAWPRLTDWI